MTAAHDRPWWQAHQAALLEDLRPGDAELNPPVSPQVLALFAEVEEAFARLGGPDLGWPDPHELPDGTWRDVEEAEYSRCEHPQKYRILWTRADAWVQALLRAGWADALEVEGPDQGSWLVAPRSVPHRTTVLRPHRDGASVLRLARTRTEEGFPGLVPGIGDPSMPIGVFPFCGCDACDGGSAELLEDLDQLILSVIEGSFELVRTRRRSSFRTSFRAHSGAPDDDHRLALHIAGVPWDASWTPRPLTPACEDR